MQNGKCGIGFKLGPGFRENSAGTLAHRELLAAALTNKGVSATSAETLDQLIAKIRDYLYKSAVVRSGTFTDTALNATTKTRDISFGVTYASAPTVIVACTAYTGQIACSAINITTTGFTFKYVVTGGIYNNVTFTWFATTPKESVTPAVQTGIVLAVEGLATELTFKGLTANASMGVDTLVGLITSGLAKGAASASGNFTDTALINGGKYRVVNFGVDFGDAPSVNVSYSGGNFSISASEITRTGFKFGYYANGGIYNGVTFSWTATKS